MTRSRSFSAITSSWQQQIRVAVNGLAEASLIALYGSIAILLLVGTLFFGYVLPQTPGRLTRASVDLIPHFSLWSWLTSLPVPIPETNGLVAGSLLFFIAIAFVAYGIALYLSWMHSATRHGLLLIVAMGILFSFANVWALPNLNTDIYNYIVDGRVAAVYGENPYSVAADQFPDDPIYPYASDRFTDAPVDKLPVWVGLTVVLARISGDKPVTNLLIFRLALFLFNVLSLGLVILVVRALDARRLATGAILYSWNPIIILFAQSKTDTVMAFFVLLAAWALVVYRRWFFALTFLAMSVLVKLITLPLIALVMLRSMKLKRWNEVAIGVLGAVVLLGFGVALLLFSEPDGALLLKYVSWLGAMGPFESTVVNTLILTCFILLLGGIGLVQNGTERRLFVGSAVVMLYLVFLIADFTRAWYLITVVALVAIAVNRHISIVAWAASLFSFLYNFWNGTFTTEFPSPDIVSVERSLLLAVFVGALMLYSAVLLLRRGRARTVN